MKIIIKQEKKRENRMGCDNRGETLVELIVSLALLTLLVTMLVTAFQASTQSMYNTIATKRDINTQVGNLLGEESLEGVRDLTIQYRYSVEGIVHKGSFETELVQTVNGSMCRFR